MISKEIIIIYHKRMWKWMTPNYSRKIEFVNFMANWKREHGHAMWIIIVFCFTYMSVNKIVFSRSIFWMKNLFSCNRRYACIRISIEWCDKCCKCSSYSWTAAVALLTLCLSSAVCFIRNHPCDMSGLGAFLAFVYFGLCVCVCQTIEFIGKRFIRSKGKHVNLSTCIAFGQK